MNQTVTEATTAMCEAIESIGRMYILRNEYGGWLWRTLRNSAEDALAAGGYDSSEAAKSRGVGVVKINSTHIRYDGTCEVTP